MVDDETVTSFLTLHDKFFVTTENNLFIKTIYSNFCALFAVKIYIDHVYSLFALLVLHVNHLFYIQ
jgi:hypothetical protein